MHSLLSSPFFSLGFQVTVSYYAYVLGYRAENKSQHKSTPFAYSKEDQELLIRSIIVAQKNAALAEGSLNSASVDAENKDSGPAYVSKQPITQIIPGKDINGLVEETETARTTGYSISALTIFATLRTNVCLIAFPHQIRMETEVGAIRVQEI
jgi:hypothetical protein